MDSTSSDTEYYSSEENNNKINVNIDILSDTEYYSSEESNNIMDCSCNNNGCLIFCFNKNTNQFESIDCKIINI